MSQARRQARPGLSPQLPVSVPEPETGPVTSVAKNTELPSQCFTQKFALCKEPAGVAGRSPAPIACAGPKGLALASRPCITLTGAAPREATARTGPASEKASGLRHDQPGVTGSERERVPGQFGRPAHRPRAVAYLILRAQQHRPPCSRGVLQRRAHLVRVH